MKRDITYMPHYKGFTASEKRTLKKIRGHENVVELYEHGIISKSECIQAIELLYM